MRGRIQKSRIVRWTVLCFTSVLSCCVLATLGRAQNTVKTPELDRRFQQFDKNQDGKITPDEVEGFPQLLKIVQEADADNDGAATLEELRRYFVRRAVAGALKRNPEPVRGPVWQGPRVVHPGALGVGRRVEDLEFTDVDGRARKLSELQAGPAMVLAMTSASCPASKRYVPTLARLEEAHREQGVAFVYVNVTASDSGEQIRKTRSEHGLQGAYVHDVEGTLAAALEARTTTEVFVLDRARTLVYRGAIDDQYGVDYSRAEPRRTFLADALAAALAGAPPEVAATEAPGCVLDLPASEPAETSVAYHNRISRIVQANCLECHRDGGAAPFSLATVDDLVAHAGMIREVVQRGTMPPWFASPSAEGHPAWANDRSLSQADKRDLLAWLSGPRPLGNPADAPLPRTFADAWEIGAPDEIVALPEPIAVKATGVMAYQNITVQTSFAEDRWVQAFEIQPTAREVVHHVLVHAIPPKTEASGGAARDRAAAERMGFFAVYVPGNSTQVYPAGMAKRLPAGATLRFQMHYTPSGTATSDQTRLGIVFAKAPPRYEVRGIGIFNTQIKIPAGAANHEETATLTIPADVEVLALMPHMHLRGKAFRYEATRPDGRSEILLDVPRYDFNWQLHYRYAEPLPLPRGTELRVTGWYDNSEANPANPDPHRDVRWGPQTYDEMLGGYVEYLIPTRE